MTGRTSITPSAQVAAIGVTLCALWPSRLEAHLVTTGLGPVYDGISHVLLSADDLVPITAMALLAGLNGRAAGRLTLFVLSGAWLAGGLIGFFVGAAGIPSAATAASFLVIGGLTAADRRLSPAVVAVLAVAVGSLHGWLNGSAMALTEGDASGLVGITAVTFVVVALVSAFVVSIQTPWARIAFRVAGSWVAAVGLLMLGWSLRGTP